MSTIKIDFSELEAAARKANNVADEMLAYADTLTRTMGSALSDIEGGSSFYTSNASSLAQQKARSLRSRASRYDGFARDVASFVDSARAADKAVKGELDKLAGQRAEDLKWWQKAGYGLYKFCNGKFGSSEIGAFLNNAVNVVDTNREKKRELIKGVYEWFRYGEGRYVLEIAIKAIEFIAALVTVGKVVLAMAATFPVGFIFGAIMIGLGAFALAKKSVDLALTGYEGFRAMGMNNTEPGQARYYGTATSWSEFARKETTSESYQRKAKIFDTAGEVADLLFNLGTLGMTEKYGQPVFQFSKDTLKENAMSLIGFDFDPSKRDFVFSLEKALGFDSFDIGTISNIFDGLKNFTRFGEDGYARSALSLTSNALPGIGALGHADKAAGFVH